MPGAAPFHDQQPTAAPVGGVGPAPLGLYGSPDLTAGLSPATVLALQRAAGNVAVGRVLERARADRVIARTHQRVGTGELSSAKLSSNEQEIFPGAAPAAGSSAPRQ